MIINGDVDNVGREKGGLLSGADVLLSTMGAVEEVVAVGAAEVLCIAGVEAVVAVGAAEVLCMAGAEFVVASTGVLSVEPET